jgi:hypothetical protein
MSVQVLSASAFPWCSDISLFVAILDALDSVINANGSGGSTWRFFALAC